MLRGVQAKRVAKGLRQKGHIRQAAALERKINISLACDHLHHEKIIALSVSDEPQVRTNIGIVQKAGVQLVRDTEIARAKITMGVQIAP